MAVRNINFKINKGSIVGLLGPNGCGKSTLIDIFMGLIPPDKGKVFIDGNPLDLKNNYNNLNCWQSIITHVPQSIYLIDGSILENIAFGIKKEEININKIWEVVKLAKIEEYIKKNEDYKTELGYAVRVDKFADSSIDMYIRCFTKTDDWDEWLAVKERLAIEIKQIVEKNNASFAFPSQSIYVEKK